MFARIVTELKQASVEQRRTLLFNLIEGKLTWGQLVHSFSSTGVVPFGGPDWFEDALSSLSSGFNREMVPEQAKAYMAQFSQLSIQERIENAEQYKVALLKYLRAEGPTYQGWIEQLNKDHSYGWATALFVRCYAQLIYDHTDASTHEQIEALQQLLQSNHKKRAGEYKDNYGFSVHIQEFLRLYKALSAANIKSDQEKLFIDNVENFVVNEIAKVAPFNKKVQFLKQVKREVNQDKWNEKGWKFRFWQGKTPDGIEQSRLVLDEKAGLSDAKMDYYEAKFDHAVVDTAFANVKTLLDGKAAKCISRAEEVTELYQRRQLEASRVATDSAEYIAAQQQARRLR